MRHGVRFVALSAWLIMLGCSTESGDDAGTEAATAGGSGGDGSGAGGTGTAGTGATGTGGSGGSTGGATGAAGAGTGGTATAGSGGTGGSSGGSGVPPSACPASDEGNTPLGEDVFVAHTGKEAVSALTYTNVGVPGAYAKVTHNWESPECDGTCNKRDHQVSGPLAPFNEDQSMIFAGPTDLYQIAVYYPGAGSWERVAYWDRCTTEGLTVMDNKWWHPCGGFFQSFVSYDTEREAAGEDPIVRSDTPTQFPGHIPAGSHINIMSDIPCDGTTDGTDCGWSQGTAMRGFAGDADGSKIFATKFRMPIDSAGTPAYWILPGQVLRTAQYGCNCRGMGSDDVYKGGCGEIDVAEILGGVTDSREATTTLYSYQDITGGGSVTFNRPVEYTATFLVIFDAPTRQIAIRRVGALDFDFASAIPDATVDAWLADPGTVRELQ